MEADFLKEAKPLKDLFKFSIIFSNVSNIFKKYSQFLFEFIEISISNIFSKVSPNFSKI